MKQIVLFIICAGFLLLPASILAVEENGQEEIIQNVPKVSSGKSAGISETSAGHKNTSEGISAMEKDAQNRINVLVGKIKSLTDRSKEPELQKEIEKIKAEIAAKKENTVH
jgi:hypothetical protein